MPADGLSRKRPRKKKIKKKLGLFSERAKLLCGRKQNGAWCESFEELMEELKGQKMVHYVSMEQKTHCSPMILLALPPQCEAWKTS